MVIQRIRPLSAARIIASLYAVLGIVFGAILFLIVLAGGLATSAFAADPSRASRPGPMIGLGALVLFPIGYAVLGFVMALIGASLYNVAASLIGGVEIEVRESGDAVKP
jgi:hypothetical protein